jgi:hypothetical protein
MSRFRAVDEGVQVDLAGPESALLSRLTSLLGGAGVDKDDPAREWLLPRLYPNDENASREFVRLAGKERVELRSADRERYKLSLDLAANGRVVLSDNDAAAWARVIAEARIVLAARKGLFETGLPEGPVDDPEVTFVVFLSVIQEELVEQMLTNMEDAK